MIPQNQRSILPLSFPVDVVGIKQQATVIEDVSDIESFKYRIRFDDGFEDIFTIIEGPEIMIQASESNHEHHANALLNDLYLLTNIEPGIFFYMLPMTLEGETINVWMVEDEPRPGEKQCVNVSYNQRLQFEMYLANEKQVWRYRKLNRLLTSAEKEMAIELASTMETIRSALQL